MAQRRMLSQDIVSSDAFLDMPVSSQVLYFHLAIRADDDGFVSPKMVMRLVGSSSDDLKVLITKRFLLPFESGVVVIKHWLIHNLIRADMYKETMYKKEKEQLGLNENGAYTELRDGVAQIKKIEAPKWLKERRKEVCTANVPKTAPRIGKDRIGKDKELPSSKDDEFSQFWKSYPKKVGKGAAEKAWQKHKPNLAVVLEAIEAHKKTDQWSKDNGQFIPHPATWLNQKRWEDEVVSNKVETIIL